MEGGSIFTFYLLILIIVIIIVIIIIIKLVIKFTKFPLNIIIITMVNDLGDGGQQPRSGRV